MVLETHKIGSLYFVKNPYRRDLDKFCTTPVELQKIFNDPSLRNIPVVYECYFWLAVPKFKKLSAAALKKLFGERSLEENPFKKMKSTAAKPTNQKPLKKYKKCI
jgi:hypothetical protein